MTLRIEGTALYSTYKARLGFPTYLFKLSSTTFKVKD